MDCMAQGEASLLEPVYAPGERRRLANIALAQPNHAGSGWWHMLPAWIS